MSGDPSSRIELDDIQNGALHPGPSPYEASTSCFASMTGGRAESCCGG